jgi:hypothetical protein
MPMQVMGEENAIFNRDHPAGIEREHIALFALLRNAQYYNGTV